MGIISDTTVVKTPEESDLYGFDWTDLLADGETLSGTPVVTEITTTDLTFGSPSINGSVVEVRISGGTAGVSYCLKCKVTTSANNTKVGLAYLYVADCSQF